MIFIFDSSLCIENGHNSFHAWNDVQKPIFLTLKPFNGFKFYFVDPIAWKKYDDAEKIIDKYVKNVLMQVYIHSEDAIFL